MKLEKISPAVEGGASVHLPSEQAFYTGNGRVGQGVSWGTIKRIPPMPPAGQLAPDFERGPSDGEV